MSSTELKMVEGGNGATLHEEHVVDTKEIVVLTTIEETETSKVVWLIAMCVSMGGFLFGYDTGYISSVLVTIKDDLGHNLSSNEQELITSITSGGALIGAVFAGLTADKHGRKISIYCGCAVFIIGSILQAAAFSVVQMTVGRFVVGLGVGSAAMVVPLYISEIAPAKHRGRMIAMETCNITGGQFVAYCIGAAFAELRHGGWRYVVAIGAIPAIFLACFLPWCPESPRQLVAHNRTTEADAVLTRIFPTATAEQRQNQIQAIQQDIHQASELMSDKSLWWSYKQLHVVPANFRAMITACTVMGISQLCGFNTLMYYSGTLFSLVGFNKPVAVSIVVGAMNFFGCCINLLLIDRVGRRRLLIVTVLGMSLTLSLAAVAFHYIPIDPKSLTLETDSLNWAGIVVLVAIIIYVGFFGTGVAPVSWMGAERLPLEVRAMGTMVMTVTCWATNIIIASTFLSMMKGMTPSGAFGFYAAICFIGFLFAVFFFAETKGMSLEEVREIFNHGFGVRFARKWQKEHVAESRKRIGGV
ncbi:Fc.00g055950.m01.CDS01 [Cosmosporella sp. VM-42]